MISKRAIRLMIAVILAVMFGFVLVALIFIVIPAGNKDVLQVTLGFLGGAFVTMIAFYFGDSDGKDFLEAKDE